MLEIIARKTHYFYSSFSRINASRSKVFSRISLNNLNIFPSIPSKRQRGKQTITERHQGGTNFTRPPNKIIRGYGLREETLMSDSRLENQGVDECIEDDIETKKIIGAKKEARRGEKGDGGGGRRG